MDERDELRRLVDELDEADVPVALAQLHTSEPGVREQALEELDAFYGEELPVDALAWARRALGVESDAA